MQSSKHEHPVCFLLGPSVVFSSLDFSIFLYELQSWEMTVLVTLLWRGKFYFPHKAKLGNSFSQHPVARGFAAKGLRPASLCWERAGLWEPQYFVTAGRSHPNATLHPSHPVSKGDQDVVGSPLPADQSSQSKGGECQELGDRWESLDGGSSCPAQTARTSQHMCPLSPTCVLVGLVRPRVTEGRSGDKDSFLADVWPAEHCFLPWS